MKITLTVFAWALCASGCATSKNAATSSAPANPDGALHRQPGMLQANDEDLKQRLAGIPNDVLRKYGLYRLSSGESFAQVSHNTGVRMHDLAFWNNITAPKNLTAGQLIWIIEPQKRPNQALESQPVRRATPSGGQAHGRRPPRSRRLLPPSACYGVTSSHLSRQP